MKTPRFFIALAIFAFVFTTALISLDSAIRPARAETLPVLRLDPRMGDPEEPGFRQELPFDDWSVESRIATPYESLTPTISPTLRQSRSYRLASILRFSLMHYLAWVRR